MFKDTILYQGIVLTNNGEVEKIIANCSGFTQALIMAREFAQGRKYTFSFNFKEKEVTVLITIKE